MKIAFFIGQLSNGGAEWQCLTNACLLAQIGHDVTLYTLSQENDYLQRRKTLPATLQIVSLCNLHNKNALFKLISLAKATISLRRQLQKQQLLYAWLELPHLLSFFATIFTPIKLVWAIRNTDFSSEPSYWKMAWMVKFCRYLCFRVDALVANSQPGLQFYCDTLGYRCQEKTVIHNILDDKVFNQQPLAKQPMVVNDNDILIMTIARITPMKGYGYLIKAIPQIISQTPRARFVFIGDGQTDYINQLKTLADKLNVSKHISWLGKRQDIGALLSICDVFVLSSVCGEGLSNALLEAAAYHCVCLSTPIGDNRLIINNDELILTPQSPENIALKVNAVLSLSEQQRQQLIATRQAHIRKTFTEQGVRDDLVEFLKLD